MARIRVPTLTLGIWSDMLYPAYQQRQIHEMLRSNGVPSRYVEVDSPHGHDAFLINLDQVGAPIARFLDDVRTGRAVAGATDEAGAVSDG